jgi:hypothetical protein
VDAETHAGPKVKNSLGWSRGFANLITIVSLGAALTVYAVKETASTSLRNRLEKMKFARSVSSDNWLQDQMIYNSGTMEQSLLALSEKIANAQDPYEEIYRGMEEYYSHATLTYGLLSTFSDALSPLPEPLEAETESLKKQINDLRKSITPVTEAHITHKDAWRSQVRSADEIVGKCFSAVLIWRGDLIKELRSRIESTQTQLDTWDTWSAWVLSCGIFLAVLCQLLKPKEWA